MLSILLIEDEQPAMERLRRLVLDFDPDVRIVAELGAVGDAVQWLATHPAPDLILADIQLSDGLSHRIFERQPVACPVIFVTAFDHYLLQAFDYHSIDYVLKPVRADRLHRALNKYLRLRSHFVGSLPGLSAALATGSGSVGSAASAASVASVAGQRILGKKGTEWRSLSLDEIAWFYTEHKVCFAITTDRVRYIVERTLSDLEASLPAAQFFRVNRQYLCHIHSVRSASPAGKGRLRLTLTAPTPEPIEVSQEKAADFKVWMGGR